MQNSPSMVTVSPNILEMMSTSDRLVKILPNPDVLCPTCNKSEFVDHLHYIMSEEKLCDPFVDMPSIVEILCSNCSSSGPGLKMCTGCRSRYYCNKICQKSSWIQHQRECEIGISSGSMLNGLKPENAVMNGDCVDHCSKTLKGMKIDGEVSTASTGFFQMKTNTVESKPNSSPILFTRPEMKITCIQDIKEPVKAPKANYTIAPDTVESKTTMSPILKANTELKDIQSTIREPKRTPTFDVNIASTIDLPKPKVIEPSGDKLTPTINSLSNIKPSGEKQTTPTKGVSKKQLFSLSKPNRLNFKLPSMVDNMKKMGKYSAAMTQVYDVETFKFFIIFDIDKFIEVSTGLNEYMSTQQNRLTTAQKGQVVAVRGTDGDWYRACVLDINSDQSLKVLMVDPGYVEDVNEYIDLPEKFCDTPSLLGFLSPIGSFDPDVFKQLEGDTPYEMALTVLENNDGVVKCKCFMSQFRISCEVSIVSYLKAAEDIMKPKIISKSPIASIVRAETAVAPITTPVAAAPTKMIAPTIEEVIKSVLVEKIPLNTPLNVIPVYQEVDQTTFFIIGNAEIMNELVGGMDNCLAKGIKVKPQVGVVVLAKSCADDQWYRAVVTSTNNGKCRVYYIDFGNEEDLSNDDLLSLLPEFQTTAKPAQAIKCKLVKGTQANFDCIATCLQESEAVKMQAISCDGSHYRVELIE